MYVMWQSEECNNPGKGCRSLDELVALVVCRGYRTGGEWGRRRALLWGAGRRGRQGTSLYPCNGLGRFLLEFTSLTTSLLCRVRTHVQGVVDGGVVVREVGADVVVIPRDGHGSAAQGMQWLQRSSRCEFM